MGSVKNMETERLIIDPIRETDKEDYFNNISHDKKVLETFICRYADTLEEFDFSSYPGRQNLLAIRLKETGQLLNMVVEDMRTKGISPIYLVTDHSGFYERYGWEFLCLVQSEGQADMSRMYIHR
jgi:hypothetical protein